MTAVDLDAAIADARGRLQSLALYPKPLRPDVRVAVWPWLFRIPGFRRYIAYAFVKRVAFKETPEQLVARNGQDRLERLLVHELCHVWQFSTTRST